MISRAASVGRMALRSRTRLLARTNTNPSSSSLSLSSLASNNSWQEYKYSRSTAGSINELHTFATRLSLEDDRDEQRRLQSTGLPSINTVLSGNKYSLMNTTTSSSSSSSSSSALPMTSRFYHTTPPQERAVAIILGAGALSATAYAASSAITAYKEYKASIPDPPTEEELKEQAAAAAAAGKEQKEKEEAQPKEKAQPAGERENIFTKWFGVGVGAKYYEGGFEESMTRREAALILGIRESSSAKRIKDAHRKLLILNHPDTGGSTYMSLKINEAKELLLKGKGRV